MAGWRVGMLIGREEYLNDILRVKTQMDSGMFYGIQKGYRSPKVRMKIGFIRLIPFIKIVENSSGG